MSEVIAVDETELDELLASGALVVLDLWAPWCQPCRTLSPLLETLAGQGSTSLTVAKLNVEKYPDVQQRFGVRGIPTLLLFKNGVEISRQVGVRSLPQLRGWLEPEGAVFQTAATPAPASRTPWPSFYGDPSLHAFLAQRLKAHAEQGEIRLSFNPFWADNQGSISAALVHHDDPAVFERISGLPAAIGILLETQLFLTPQDVDALFSALTPGKDVSAVPLRWLHALLGDELLAWSAALSSEPLNQLRLSWLALAERWLNGDSLQEADWHPLITAESSLTLNENRELERHLLSLLTTLSPPPDAGDTGSWLLVKTQINFAVAQFMQIADGWTPEERATPARRFAWFEQKQAEEPGQQLSDERLRELQEQWLRENAEFSVKEQGFYARYAELQAAFHRPLNEELLRLFALAPVFVPPNK